jgi:hypothetical protein
MDPHFMLKPLIAGTKKVVGLRTVPYGANVGPKVSEYMGTER